MMSGLMKMAIILTTLTFLSACSTTPREKRVRDTLDCTKELMDHDANIRDSYKVCRDLLKRSGGKLK